MERLTKRAEGTVVYAGGYKQYEGGDIPAEVSTQGVRELLVRLAEYEDTGLGPEQRENAKAIIESVFSDDTSKAERIRELLKADRDGRLVVLPCKVGDTVWITGSVRRLYSEKVRTFFCGDPSYGRGMADNSVQMIRTTGCDIPIREFGKTVFPTREEAEEVLEEMKDE